MTDNDPSRLPDGAPAGRSGKEPGVAHIEEPTRPAVERPPITAIGPLGWARANLFSSIPNTILTILGVLLLARAIPPLVEWALVNAVWSGPADACRAAKGSGACWAMVSEKYRLILFGFYPWEEQWRPLAAMLLFIGMLGVSCVKLFWRRWLFYVWGAALVVCGVLMWGGVFGLTPVSNDKWGGLPLTLILSVVGIVAAFPLSILLALGRQSNLPAIKTLSVVYIELIRGIPLISVLFMASVMFPLFMPEGVSVDKLLRAQIGIILFAAAYLAEAVRGGLQAIPRGQYEAADALGLGYWRKMRLVVLPQALRLVIPPMVNQFISTFKDTSLVIIIGLYDLLTTAKAAIVDPVWRMFYIEAYIVAALIYFLFCYFMSRYSQYVEKDLGVGSRR